MASKWGKGDFGPNDLLGPRPTDPLDGLKYDKAWEYVQKNGGRPASMDRNADGNGAFWDKVEAFQDEAVKKQKYDEMVSGIKSGANMGNSFDFYDGKEVVQRDEYKNNGIKLVQDPSSPSGWKYVDAEGRKINDAVANNVSTSKPSGVLGALDTGASYFDKVIGKPAATYAGEVFNYSLTKPLEAIATGGIAPQVSGAIEAGKEVNAGLDNPLSKIGDVLKPPGGGGTAADPVAEDIRRLQLKATKLHDSAIDEYGRYFGRTGDQDIERDARTSMESETRGLVGQQKAARDQIQGLVAKRGLGNTSQGLAQQGSSEMAYSDKIGATRAGIKDRVKSLWNDRQNKGMDLTKSVMSAQNVPINFYGSQPDNDSGIAPLLGGLIGAGFASPGEAGQGFQVGMGAGQSIQGYRR